MQEHTRTIQEETDLTDIAIVTDSTSDMSHQSAADNGITIIPLYVTHNGTAYKDGIDITPNEFYSLLSSSEELPKSSQPTPEQFRELYERLLDSGKTILSFHLSSGLSSTAATARSVAESLSKDRIHVVDTGSISYGIAFQALEAARLAAQGFCAREILSRVERLKEKTELLFTLETLHYLYKGGRIGKVESLVGHLLKINPIVRVENGIYVPIGKTRSVKQALKTMADFLTKTFGHQKVLAAIGHGQALGSATMLREVIASTLDISEEPAFFEVGPVIGVHTGPGTTGIAVYPAAY